MQAFIHAQIKELTEEQQEAYEAGADGIQDAIEFSWSQEDCFAAGFLHAIDCVKQGLEVTQDEED